MLGKWLVNSNSLLAFIYFFIHANNMDMCILGGSCCFAVVVVIVGFVCLWLFAWPVVLCLS